MKILYLRTVYLLNLIAGGSVGHTAGVNNSHSKKHTLTVFSNDQLAKTSHYLNLIRPLKTPFLPNKYKELLYNFRILRKIKNWAAKSNSPLFIFTKLIKYILLLPSTIIIENYNLKQPTLINFPPDAMLVERGNPEQLADAIHEFDPEKQKKVAHNACKIGLEKYTCDINTSKIISRLYEIIS
ncbi:MAG: hypothetical protein JXB49_11605 [Bacteroidales bacterium]|nr:hypothetical protein [Bacteroidales bacterium]